MIWRLTDKSGVVCRGGGVQSWRDHTTVRDEFFLMPKMTESWKTWSAWEWVLMETPRLCRESSQRALVGMEAGAWEAAFTFLQGYEEWGQSRGRSPQSQSGETISPTGRAMSPWRTTPHSWSTRSPRTSSPVMKSRMLSKPWQKARPILPKRTWSRSDSSCVHCHWTCLGPGSWQLPSPTHLVVVARTLSCISDHLLLSPFHFALCQLEN